MSPEADSSAQTQPAVRTLQVQYYAQLREEAGRSEETVESTAATVAELFEELDQRYDFSLPPDDLRVAVNASFADWDTVLDAQDLVVFIPPIAGG
jgi:molybdopterin converting factor subunit 1